MSQDKAAASQEKPASKYGAMIQKARNLENQNTGLPEDPPTILPESQQSGKPENQNAGQREREEEVNLSIKVPKRLRRHWVAEAKRRDTSLTAIITASLKEILGEPQDA